MDEWAWGQLQPWLALRLELPAAPSFCVINGPDAGAPVISGGGARRPATHGHDLSPGIDNAEIIDAVHARRAPMIPVSASLRLGRSWAGTSLVARRRSRRVWGRGLMAQWRGATALAFVVRFMLRA
jgi:hypothetical protein